jgi:outer membrane lipoprotein-sorting protein
MQWVLGLGWDNRIAGCLGRAGGERVRPQRRRGKTGRWSGRNIAGRLPGAVQWRLILAEVVCALLGPVAALAGNGLDPQQLATQAYQARWTVAYTGVRTLELYRGDRKVTITQKVSHAPGGRYRFEVVAPREMAGELIVSDGRRVWRYSPRRGEAYVGPAHPPGGWSPPSPGGAQKKLTWSLGGEQTVAGRRCLVIVLRGAQGQDLLQLAVDAEHHVPLASERRCLGGRLAERWYFREVTFPATIDHKVFTFEPPAGVRVVHRPAHAQRVPLEEAERRLQMKALVPEKLPAGFALLREQVSIVRHGPHRALWLPFSNGARTFSIFQSRRLPPHVPLPLAAARWDVGPYTLVVVGKLSPKELEQMRSCLPSAGSGPPRTSP